MPDLELLRSMFVRTYAAVPAKLREEIVVLVDERPFNWNSAFLEIQGRTETGDSILRHLDELGLLSVDEGK
ncbi:hypothetical protein HY995_01490 [Candidatus Micrarchaeota archaeon]|nr:hypothetical protein [Candidatus Micrarchaeota archaeon]MBI5176740.1 hypothetical protein [Candidatus Micrarchaeota archaeon]